MTSRMDWMAVHQTARAMYDALLANRATGPMRSAVLKEAIDQYGQFGDRTYPYASQAYLPQARKYLRDHGVPIVATREGAYSTYSIEEVTSGAHAFNFERYERDLWSSGRSFYRALDGAHGRGKQVLRDRIYQALLAIGLDLDMTQQEVENALKRKLPTDPELLAIYERHLG